MIRQVVINHQLVSYIWQGSHTFDKTLLFLHGWRSSKESWFSVIRKITVINNQLSVIALDFPGFGQSPAPKEPWDVEGYANLISEFITKLNLRNVIIVGHSFGGRVGIKLGSMRLDLVKQLILVDSAGFAIDTNKKSAIGVVAKIVKPIFKPKFMQGLRKKIYKSIGAEDYVATPELQKTFIKVLNEDLTENMKRILQPTLIVWGENDKETPLSDGQKMHSLIHNSKLIIFPSAGHFSFIDKTDEFVKKLNDFINNSNTRIKSE